MSGPIVSKDTPNTFYMRAEIPALVDSLLSYHFEDVRRLGVCDTCQDFWPCEAAGLALLARDIYAELRAVKQSMALL